MTYEVELVKDAATYLRRLDKPTRQRIGQRLDQLGEDPLSHSKPLRGTEGIRSSRVGDYRILFQFHEGRLLVMVLAIGPRGQVYRQL